MKPRFSISRKIGFGFAVVLTTTLILFLLTYDTLKTGRSTNDQINEVYNPSISVLEQFKGTILRSRTSITSWAFVQSREDTKEKLALVNMISEEIPELKAAIDSLSMNWTEGQRRKKEKVYKDLDELLALYLEVQSNLNDMKSYDDALVRFRMNELAEEDGTIYNKSNELIANLNDLIADHRSMSTEDSVTMIQAFDRLENYLRNLSIALLIFGIIIAFLTIRSIVKPVVRLKGILEELGKGIFPEKTVVETGDEIGEMSEALEQLVLGLKRTTNFSREVGQGNFDIDYRPLSDKDVLGKALLSMRDDLREKERGLERKVRERTAQLEKAKNRTEELLEGVRASIRYAKKLQDSILPSARYITTHLPEHFIFFKPKDIVSGDFYFIKERFGKVVFAAVDCTGHGVPGAFMSLVGHNALNRAVNESQDLNPASMLKKLSRLSAKALNRTTESSKNRDGMDIALCVYDRNEGTLEYAGASNPLYIWRQGELMVRKPDKIAIGDPERDADRYTRHKIQLHDGDMIYIFSDGYVDQFGGPQGRKFMFGPFRAMLTEIASSPVKDQHKHLSLTLDRWMKEADPDKPAEQIDDILIIGVRHRKPAAD